MAVAKKFGPQVGEQAATRALASGATHEVAFEAGQAGANKLVERAVICITGMGQVGSRADVDVFNKVLDSKADAPGAESALPDADSAGPRMTD